MKPIKLLVFSIVALLFVSGCKIQTVQQYEDEKNADQSKVVIVDEQKNADVNENTPANQVTTDSKNQSNSQTNVSEKAEALQTAVKKEPSTAQNPLNSTVPTTKETKDHQVVTSENKAVTNDKEVTTTSPKTASTVKQPTQQTPSKKEVVSPKKEEKTSTTTTNTPAKTPESKPKPIVKPVKKEYVTVSITMDLLLQEENRNKLPEALQSTKYIPANGVVVNSKVEIKEGASAWDAILALCQAKNIHIDYEYSSTFGGIYIKGISHIYEFSAGHMSGWMYSVNGKKAPVGVSGYELEDKDVIALKYTVNGGSDLGW